MAFELKRNDLRPHYRIQLTETDPNTPTTTRPVDLTAATAAYFLMKQNNVLKINRGAMTFIDRTNGIVEYPWVSGDTNASGSYDVEVEVNWSGKPQTFPSKGYFTVTISDDLG
jgi:hypothetical protein